MAGMSEAKRPAWALGMLLPGAGYARCGRCRRPCWAIWKFHDVWYEPSRAQFALCEHCWGRSTPEQRWQAHLWVASLSPAGWTNEEMDAVRRVIFEAAG